MSRATAQLVLPDDMGVIPVVGTGLTSAAAIAELKAKLALQVGTVSKVSVSEDVADIATYLTVGTGTGRDARLILKKTTAGITKTVSIVIRMVGSTFAKDTSPGTLDITEPALIGFATAYKDGDGNGGYTLDSGEFVN